MKKLFFTSLLTVFIVLLTTKTNAQEIIEISPFLSDGTTPALVRTIMGDTTDSGERNNPNRVYKLKRGEKYPLEFEFDIDSTHAFDLTIIADDDDPSNPVAPPMIFPIKNAAGDIPWTFIINRADNITVTLKNLFLQAVPPDRGTATAYQQNCIQNNGEYFTLNLDKCIFNGQDGSSFATWNAHYVYKVSNCVFRNQVSASVPWDGFAMLTWDSGVADSVIMINNTFINQNSQIIHTAYDYAKYIKFSHNTVWGSYFNPFFTVFNPNVEITDNIIIGAYCWGQRQTEINNGWYDDDGDMASIIHIDTVSNESLTNWGWSQADRKWDVHNNVYYWPQPFKQYWADSSLSAPEWMNARAQTMFSDKTTWPLLNESDNQEADPGFRTSMVDSLTTMFLDWGIAYRKINDGNGEGGFEEPDHRQYAPNGDVFLVPWPLPESFVYSNAALASASSEGLHVGDLNWYPDDLATYTDVEINSFDNLPEQYSLSDNYPNPFNPSTNIEFSIPTSGMVTLKVFNILGQEVVELLNKDLSVGSYKVNFDGKDLTSGIYFYSLRSGDFNEIKKMMLIK